MDPSLNQYLLKNRGRFTGPYRLRNYAAGAEPTVTGTGWMIYDSTNDAASLWTGAAWIDLGAGGGAVTFDAIGAGANVTAAMVVGTGASLDVAGTGTIVSTTLTSIGANTINLGADVIGLAIEASPAQTANMLDFDPSGGGTPLAFISQTGGGYFPQVGTGDAREFAATIGGSTIPAYLSAADDTTGVQLDLMLKRHTGAIAATGARVQLLKSRGTAAAETVVVTGDALGEIDGAGYDGTDYASSSRITFETEGTIGNNRMPGLMRFFTGTDAGPSVLTERMRIDSAGLVTVYDGITSPGAGANSELFGSGAVGTGDNVAVFGDGASSGANSEATVFGAGGTAAASGAAFGQGSNAGTSGTALGYLSAAGNAGIAIGAAANAAANQVSFGSNSAPITTFYVGKGAATTGTVGDVLISGTVATTNDHGGGDVTFQNALCDGDCTAGSTKIGNLIFKTGDGVDLGAGTTMASTTVMTIGPTALATVPSVRVTHATMAATPVVKVLIRNDNVANPATVGSPKFSPGLVFEGSTWAGAAEDSDWMIQNRTVSHGASHLSYMDFLYSENGAAYVLKMSLLDSGQLDVEGRLIVTNAAVVTYDITTSAAGSNLQFEAGDEGSHGDNSFSFHTLTTFNQAATDYVGTWFDMNTHGGLTGAGSSLDGIFVDMEINDNGAGAYTGILVDVTETQTPAGPNYLIDLQVDSGTIFRILNTGAIVTTPAADATYAAANTVTPSANILRVAGNGGAVSLTSTPSIADGEDGQCVTIFGTSAGNTLTVRDEDNLANTGLALEGDVDIVVGLGDNFVLCYDLGDDLWREISRNLTIDD